MFARSKRPDAAEPFECVNPFADELDLADLQQRARLRLTDVKDKAFFEAPANRKLAYERTAAERIRARHLQARERRTKRRSSTNSISAAASAERCEHTPRLPRSITCSPAPPRRSVNCSRAYRLTAAYPLGFSGPASHGVGRRSERCDLPSSRCVPLTNPESARTIANSVTTMWNTTVIRLSLAFCG